ncbi:MAG: protein kinase [Fibrobacteres bacterium]|nr:protein kinase [Fibrobacterota bacterium]
MERTLIAQDQLIGVRFEKCVVEKLIGRGGYGLSYLAFDGELQEHRVIKVSQDSGLDEATRRRHLKTFLEEGLILSRLKHPQIVTLRGQGDKHGHRYMILDYIQGYSLRAILDAVGQRQVALGCAWQDLMDPITASALILSALYPLEYAHRANVHLPDREIFGVAHRDISPGNLILGVKGNEKGRLVLIDFGTAKTALNENVTVDQNLVGTIPYMGKARLQKANSPEERALHQEFWKDFRETQHDIHAIGVLYYQLLTGRLPFYGETTPQIIVKILDREAYTQCHLDIASAHPYASGVLRKCLAWNDFNLPLSEQEYQYPDAAAMRPEMEEVFHSLSGGRSVNDVLIALGKRMAHPEALAPAEEGAKAKSGTASTGSLSMPVVPQRTSEMLRALPYPVKKRSPWPYFALGAGLLVIALGAAWRFAPRHSDLFARAKSEPGPSTHSSPLPASAQPVTAVPASGTRAPAAPAARPLPAPREILENLGSAKAASHPDKSSRPAPASAKPSSRPNPATKAARPGGNSTLTPNAGRVSPGDVAPEVPQVAPSSETSGEFAKEEFVQAQTLVREEDPSAFEHINALLARHPGSPDLRLLKSQVILLRNPSSAEARGELSALQSARPEFMHPGLFHEQSLYLLWQADAAAFEAQKTPENRVRLLKSANAYLSEYGSLPAYQSKVQGIKDRLPR